MAPTSRKRQRRNLPASNTPRPRPGVAGKAARQAPLAGRPLAVARTAAAGRLAPLRAALEAMLAGA